MLYNISKQEVKEKNQEIGHKFFSRGAMRSFNSKLESGGFAGVRDGSPGWFFVYSNQFVGSDHVAAPREYRVRFMYESGEVSAGSYPWLSSKREAVKMAKDLAAGNNG